MKRKNGFTLIELLAVIIILAAIALIIAPMVLDVIKEQQMKTFKESINGILRSSRIELVNGGLSFPSEFTYSDGKLFSPTGKELKITGKIPEGVGTLIYHSEDDIELAIHDDRFCGIYSVTNKEVDVREYTGECIIAPRVTATPEECFVFNSSTGTIVGYHLNGVQASNYMQDFENAIHTTVPEGLVCPSDIVFPDTIDGVDVKYIGHHAFTKMPDICYSEACPSTGIGITSVDFSLAKNLIMIQTSAFYENEITEIKISSSLESIDGFSNNHLTTLDLSGATSLKTIEYGCFSNNQLTNIIFPNSLERINSMAFQYNDLTNIVIPNSVTTIENRAFLSNKLTSVTIPNSVTSIEFGAFNDNQLSDDEAFIYARNEDGSIDNTTIVSYGGAKRSNVLIPSNITTIGERAFLDNQLTSVVIPNSVTSIGIYAFQSNQLTTITIPSSVTSIGNAVFYDNELTSVTIEGKSSSSDFTSYPEYSPFSWADGYSDDNIIWNG